jgi:7-keto-8-aminopelargonate synthetase-like enzyme
MRFMKRIAAELDAIEEADLTKREPVIVTPQSARIEAEAGGPVMLGDAALAQEFAARMLPRGVYVTGFSFPGVLKGAARIRTRMSAAHREGDIAAAVQAFAGTGRELEVIA